MRCYGVQQNSERGIKRQQTGAAKAKQGQPAARQRVRSARTRARAACGLCTKTFGVRKMQNFTAKPSVHFCAACWYALRYAFKPCRSAPRRAPCVRSTTQRSRRKVRGGETARNVQKYSARSRMNHAAAARYEACAAWCRHARREVGEENAAPCRAAPV